MTAAEPPAELFDFDLHPSDHFEPDRDDAYITSRWVPVKLPWLAAADIISIDGNRIHWKERWGFFSCDAILERTAPRTMMLRTRNSRVGFLRLPPVNWAYEVDGAGRNLLVLRSSLGDMMSVVYQQGDRLAFHLRFHWGIGVHKVGTISRPRR